MVDKVLQPSKPFRLLGVLTAAVALLADVALAGVDVDTGSAGREPVAAVVNPTNPSNVAVANFSQLRLSTDFGQTFPTVVNAAVPPGLVGMGYGTNADDALAFDSQGRLFWVYLLPLDGDGDGNVNNPGAGDDLTVVVAQINPMTGAVVGNAVDLTPGPGLFIDDKPWIAADFNPSSPFVDNIYVVWTRLTGGAGVNFSRSTDNGVNFSAPAVISSAGEGFVWPTHVAVGPNGDVYAAYHTSNCGGAGGGTTQVIRDSIGGANLAAGTIVQKTAAFTAGQATITCNRQDDPSDTMLGDTVAGAAFWMQGSNAPYVLADPVRSGHIYVVANDDPTNTFGSGDDDGDVVLARSTDDGNTWSVSTISHGPAGTLQVFPMAAIDQDGKIAVHWYDNRFGATNAAGNWLLDRFGTVSEDGGLTFTNDFQISDAPFDPDLGATCRFGSLATNDCTARIGEYHGIWAVDGFAYTTRTGNLLGAHQIFFDIFSMDGAYADRLEPNESRDAAVVADLGSDDTYNEPVLSIHTATDEDFFRVATLHSGKLEVSILFNEVVSVPDIEIQDAAGNMVASGVLTTPPMGEAGFSTAMAVIPVVQGETYFVRVFDPNAPNTFAPQASYDLTIVNRAAPVPFGLDLLATSDSGENTEDNITNDNTPTIQLRVDVADAAAMGIDILSSGEVPDNDGYAVAVFDNGNKVGYADPVGDSNETLWSFSFPALVDGAHSMTAKVEVFDAAMPGVSGFGEESESLLVIIDTTAPATPAAPDLLASSDSGGISIDNITTIMSPAFEGSVEANALVRIFANAGVEHEVGRGNAGSTGDYEITVEPLADGVYAVTASAEDTAGNVSARSAALQVTIANQILNLAGATATVMVDLGASTLTGYPSIPGGVVGILGIPQVNLDVNGQALAVDGTGGPDSLSYSPSGIDSGSLILAGRDQVLNFGNVGGGFTLDPLDGDDVVAVTGTVSDDSVVGMVDTMVTMQVNSLLPVVMPSSSVERVTPISGEGVDTVDLTIFDSVNESLTVDAGGPSTNPKRGDLLIVRAGSDRAKILKQTSAVKGSGSVLISYDHTTGNASRVDFIGVEKFEKDAKPSM